MLHQRTVLSLPVSPGLVYHHDGDDAQDVIRILAVEDDSVRYEHLDWTLDDGWEPETVVRSTSTKQLRRRLRCGHRLIDWPTGQLTDVVFHNV